jgi:hypothetical protein
MSDFAEQRCMICRRPNPGLDDGGLPNTWGASTDKAGEVHGVICPSCITGEVLSMAAGVDSPFAARWSHGAYGS